MDSFSGSKADKPFPYLQFSVFVNHFSACLDRVSLRQYCLVFPHNNFAVSYAGAKLFVILKSM